MPATRIAGRDPEGEGDLAEALRLAGAGREAVHRQGQQTAERATHQGEEHGLHDEGEEDRAPREAQGAQRPDLARAGRTIAYIVFMAPNTAPIPMTKATTARQAPQDRWPGGPAWSS